MDIKITSDGIRKRLDQLLEKANFVDGFLDRVVYPEYQNYQRQRWMDENSNQTGKWDKLSAAYSARKQIMYGGGPKHEWVGGYPMPWRVSGTWPSYEGAGTKMLIATGRLFHSVIGDGPDHFKQVSGGKIRIGTTVEYAPYVDDVRNYSKYDQEFISNLRKRLMDYVRS